MNTLVKQTVEKEILRLSTIQNAAIDQLFLNSLILLKVFYTDD